MTTRASLKSSTSPFAHLARPPKATDGDDDKKKDDAKKAKADDESDEDEKDEKDKKPSGRKAKKAKADDDSDDKGTDDDDDDKKDEAKKAKKAKGEDDDDMEDEEQDKDARAARARERARIRAILVSEPGIANPVAAAHLATGTSMPRGQAIEMLSAMNALSATMHVEQPGANVAQPRKDNLRDRMAEVPNPTVGADGSRAAPTMAEQIIAAGKKRRGEA